MTHRGSGTRPVAPAGWAAPRYDMPILVSAGDQVHVAGAWRTVRALGRCAAGHDEPDGGICVVVDLGHTGFVHGRPLSLLWVRRAVS